MKNLDSNLLKKFLDLALQELKGEWLLVGGTLLPALGINIRSTIDIDLVGLGEKERAQNLELMEIAEKLGLSIESINQAADFFVKKARYTDADLITFKSGKGVQIYRPSLFLYWKLKIARLTESDVEDCKSYFKYCQSQHDSIDFKALELLISNGHKAEPSLEKIQRLEQLRALLF